MTDLYESDQTGAGGNRKFLQSLQNNFENIGFLKTCTFFPGGQTINANKQKVLDLHSLHHNYLSENFELRPYSRGDPHQIMRFTGTLHLKLKKIISVN